MGASLSLMQPNRHLVLLGDSTIDNGNWCAPGPSVTEQVQILEPNTTCLAIDGALVAAIRRQAQNAPADGTHFIANPAAPTCPGAARPPRLSPGFASPPPSNTQPGS